MVRGIERGAVFRNDADRDHFLERLGEILQDTQTLCYASVLIPNHFHLLLRTGPVPISTVMRRLLTGYALWHNLTHRRHGHLFQNRFKSILCQEDVYLLELVRYIHLNPIRAHLVGDLEELGGVSLRWPQRADGQGEEELAGNARGTGDVRGKTGRGQATVSDLCEKKGLPKRGVKISRAGVFCEARGDGCRQCWV